MINLALRIRRNWLNWNWQRGHDLDSALRYRAVANLLRRTAPPCANPSNVLDVGGGANGLPLYTPDYSATTADIAFIPEAQRIPRTFPVAGSLWYLPFAQQAFNAVICLDTIENLQSGRRLAAMIELVRVAKYILILTVPCGAKSQTVDQTVFELSKHYRPEAQQFRDFLEEHLLNGVPERSDIVGMLQESATFANRTMQISVHKHINRRVVLAYWRYLLFPRWPLWGYWWGFAFHVWVRLLPWARWGEPYRYIFVAHLSEPG